MDQGQAIDVTQQALLMILLIGGPVMVIGLAVGLIISLIQALTQIQEMTLAFVPKILAIFAALAVLMPWMLAQLLGFTRSLFDLIAVIG